MTPEQQRAWMEQWRQAGRALEKVRAFELQNMTDEQALIATANVLALISFYPVPASRWSNSGLVEQQRLLHSHREIESC